MEISMTKKERTIAAFEGKEVDHAPVCMWQHVPGEFLADDDKFAECQLRAFKKTGVDFMKLSADGYFGWPSPLLKEVAKAADLYRLQPLGKDDRYIRSQIGRTKKVIKALGDECFCLYLIFAPLSCLRLMIGYPGMMRCFREDPEAIGYACSVIAEDQKLLVKGIIEEAGADGIFYSVQNAEIDRFTEQEYRSIVTPGDRAVLDFANTLSDKNAIHFCAWEQVPNRLSVWKDYKAAAVSWSRYIDIMDIKEAKERFGCTVWGGFDNRPGSLLYTASKEEIEKEVASLVESGGKRGYIVGADCSLHGSLPEERIRWVAEASRRI